MMDAVLISQTQENFHLSKDTLESLPYKDKIINQVVNRLEQEQLTKIKEDTLGILFEKLIREQEKKDLGQFYTPQEIVNYIVNFLDIEQDSKILDPTCGCGVFLVTAYNHLKKTNPNALNNIYGVDLNNSATKIARINLWLRNGQDSSSLRILEKNIKIGNSIVESRFIDNKAFNWKKEFSDILNEGGFDFIIGNPPYITLKNEKDYDVNESFFSQIADGSTNAASLVTAKSYELLKEGGVMAFVLPKTLIRVNSYSRLREFLLSNSKILHIFDLGTCFKDVRGEQIILFVQKTNKEESIRNNRVLIRLFDNKAEFYVPQKVFQKYNTFLMFEDKTHYDLIEKIKGENLESIADIFRGISISPKSQIISKSKEKGKISIIKGNDISKSSYSNGFFIDIHKLMSNSSKLEEFQKKKIILQNIFSSEAGSISAIDEKGNLNFDTVSNIVLKDNSYELEYIYGLLNSKLINFYLMYAIYNKSKLTMHTDKVYLGKIPIKKANKKNQEEIIGIIKKINKQNLKEKLSELDKKVYKLYGITKSEQNKINLALKQIMSEKSMW
jgi:type I restriction-modification system DNA methylase subunit